MSAPQTTKPTIIGLYGISGSGKTYLLKKLKQDNSLKDHGFLFRDGSDLIDEVTPGGLEAFQQMERAEKDTQIELALTALSADGQDRNKTAVIAGHYMFYDPESDDKYPIASTDKDWETYTHIIYLNVDPETIASRSKSDSDKVRPTLSIEELSEWQKNERNGLRVECRDKCILFTTITVDASSPSEQTLLELKSMLSDFKQHTEASNMSAVDIAVEAALGSQMGLEKVLLFDADKTLTAQDTESMFWKTLSSEDDTELLSKLLTKQGYSYASFRQATLLYEEKSSGVDAICDKVAAEVSMYPEMIALLARVAQDSHARAAVVTCGVHQIWEKVLKRNNLPHVQVIGGGRISDGYVVTGEIKGHVVDKLQEKKLRVLAFGDGPLGIGMLTKADQAYVVVGEESGRSTTMDAALEKAIASGLRARQIILPTTAEPRLNLERLRRYDLNDSSIHVLCKRPGKFIHATDKNARKLLQTPTRDKKNAGHDLRKHHERIGYYLATELLSEVLGVEEYDIPHVQGKPTDGYRFQDEEKTLIVPLMRGGEPMAFGVSKAMKLASFAHAYTYSDIKKGLFRGKKTIVLVDSVINSGGSVGEFMKPLREEFPDVRVVFVAGVVQSNAVVGFGPVANLLASDSNFTLVALRVSANSYVGNGVTDTGDRLFNTTYLVDKKEE